MLTLVFNRWCRKSFGVPGKLCEQCTPTDCTVPSYPDASSSGHLLQLSREDSFIKKFSTRQSGAPHETATTGAAPRRNESTAPGDTGRARRSDLELGRGTSNHVRRQRCGKMARRLVANPDESPMFCWLTITALAVLYNLWACIAREAFPEFQRSFNTIWLVADVVCDVTYLVDIIVQFRTGYLERGLVVYDSSKLAMHYVRSTNFVLDVSRSTTETLM